MATVNLQELLESSGAILTGHFKLTSGRHSNVYFEKFRVLEQPKVLSALCQEVADHFAGKVDVVAGPTTGGIIIAFEVARLMGVTANYIESEQGVKMLRRGASIPQETRVLVVDDVLTTGLSIKETIEVIEREGATLVGTAALIDRAPEPADFGVPHYSAFKVEAETFSPDDLPEWLKSIPITKPGTRA